MPMDRSRQFSQAGGGRLMTQFGVALKRVLSTRGITVEEVMRETGLSPIEIMSVLEGEKRVKARFIFQLCQMKSLQDKERELFDTWYNDLR